jgi:hypothetical protein
MMTVVKSNFVTVDSFSSSMRASLRQAATILWSLSATKVLVSLIMPLNWCCPDPFGVTASES